MTEAYGIQPDGYRLPASTHPGMVRLQVADVNRSVAWYERVLRLVVIERTADVATLGATDGVPLVALHGRPGSAPAPRHGRLGLYHYAILLPDRASLGRLALHLGGTGVRAGAADHDVSEALYLDDPDGLGIEVYADRPRSQWRHSDRELVMKTDPLDLGSLLRDAGDEPFETMPAGTVIGHVHLHVGDLSLADRFYHGALGLDRMVWSYPGALFLAAGGYHHHLGVNTWAAGARPAAAGDARLIEWELIVPENADVLAARNRIDVAGFDTASSTGLSVVVRDPWGTTLRIRTA